MDLGDRCGGYGGGLEVFEDLAERAAQVRFDYLADDLETLGRDVVPQQPELVHQLRREDALPGGQDLAELYVGRPQAFKGFSEPAGQPGPGDLAPAQLVGPALFYQLPAQDGPAEPDAGGDDPAARRQPLAPQQLGDLASRLGPEGVDAVPPREVFAG